MAGCKLLSYCRKKQLESNSRGRGKKIKKKAKKVERAWYSLGYAGWVDMGLVSKEWAWVDGNGLKRCKGAE